MDICLKSEELKVLGEKIQSLEKKYKIKNYSFFPESNCFEKCTCQGNCDGPSGGSECQWG